MSDTPIALSVSSHCWNRDLTQLALSPNTNEVWIYQVSTAINEPNKWQRRYVLDEHGGQVSGLDWCPETNLLVTCAHDRNAYVWRYDEKADTWKPTLVILRINRAATQVKWSPLGNKFAVASGAKCVPVCHFEAKNDWWVSKMIKKHKSTVLSLAWCPNNKFLVTGSTDMKCRIFSAYLENIDSAEDDGFGSVFGVERQHEFGEVLVEFDQAKAWVHAVAWSPQGFRLAFTSHASTLHFIQLLAESQPIVQTLVSQDVPLTDVHFVSDNCVVAAGFSSNIELYRVSGGSDAEPVWSFDCKLDSGKQKGVDSTSLTAASAQRSGQFNAARGLFSATVDKGAAFGLSATAVAAAADTNTRHKNIIANIQLIPSTGQMIVNRISTASLDGRICVWDLTPLKLK